MARLNSRQKRAALRRRALHDLAVSRNPSTQPIEGVLKASTDVKVHLTHYQAPQDRWEGQGKRIRKGGKVFAVTGSVKADFGQQAKLDNGVADPSSPRAPKD